jgi:hypothetical protein
VQALLGRLDPRPEPVARHKLYIQGYKW